MSHDTLSERLLMAVLSAAKTSPPKGLRTQLESDAQDADQPADAATEALVRAFADDMNDACRRALEKALRRWDFSPDDELWTQGTPANSQERRTRIYSRLGLIDSQCSLLDHRVRLFEDADELLEVVGPHEWWYDAERRAENSYYWDSYRGLLEANGWPELSLVSLERATRAIVGRLRDPATIAALGNATTYGEDGSALASRGLVVGYVQSGKTANFTGVIARAIDAGYRIVIVLAGTIEILRKQTLKRLDRELLGKAAVLQHEEDLGIYRATDPDLKGFVTYPDAHGQSKIFRLGAYTRDMSTPGAAERMQVMEARYVGNAAPEKLVAQADATVFVVKKNAVVLRRLNEMFATGGLATKLRHVPALLIDDESDQAGINTRKPPETAAELQERTETNKQIIKILNSSLPHAQYVGYTATPAASAFVDRDDPKDLYPRDFVIFLDRPAGYMGVRDFYDIDDDGYMVPDDQRPAGVRSNKTAYYRGFDAPGMGDAEKQPWLKEGELDATGERDAVELRKEAETSHPRILEALDAFVLTGAIKCFREQKGERHIKFAHHTMLVHTSHKQTEHRAVAQLIHDLWSMSDYRRGKANARLRRLWETDFEPVSRGRFESGLLDDDEKLTSDLLATTFDELSSGLNTCLKRIEATVQNLRDAFSKMYGARPEENGDGEDEPLPLTEEEILDGQKLLPALVVNSDHDFRRVRPDFDKFPMWCILVGGTALSRGFTVEHLTISYYRRRVGAADTLMQMGRWFGFRSGYSDLVRVYLGREPKGNSVVDLYDEFGAICLDEEALRQRLRKYLVVKPGVEDDDLAKNDPRWKQRITPETVPLLIQAHSNYLSVTASNKMHHTRLAYINYGAQWHEVTRLPQAKIEGALVNANLLAVQKLLECDPLKKLQCTVRWKSRNQKTKELVPKERSFSFFCSQPEKVAVEAFLYEFQFRNEGADASPRLHGQLSLFLQDPMANVGRWIVIVAQPQRSSIDTLFTLSTGEELQVMERNRSAVEEKPKGKAISNVIRSVSEPHHRKLAEYLASGDAPEADIEVEGDVAKLRSPDTAVLVFYPSLSKDEVNEHKHATAPVSFPHAIFCPPNKIPYQLEWTT